VINLVKAGKTMKQVATAEPATFIKFHGGIKSYMTVVDSARRNWMTELHIITGVPGSGKSYTAKMEAEAYLEANDLDEQVYYWSAPSSATEKAWFQGYDGESCVIINDFYGTLNIDVFKNLIDTYPYKVEQKNGHRDFLAKAVWVTSNTAWTNWWGDKLLSNKHNKEAIQRRITSERVLDTVWKPYDNITVDDDVVDEVQLQAASDRDQEDLSLLCLEEFDKDYIYGNSDDQTSLTQRMNNLRGQWDGNMF
jgi:adenylate kinase family enzyme